jgi:mannose-6-phosphate isomerase-like protein (cupin superfamily)
MLNDNLDRAAVQRRWAADGYSCEVWIDAPNQVWHDFQHDVDEVVLLVEGESTIELLGRTIRLVAGDQLEIPAGTRHTVRNTGQGPARWLHGYRATQHRQHEARGATSPVAVSQPASTLQTGS